jgi:hypothetical protein
LPKKIAEKPELHVGSALFLNAWFDLDTERNRAKYQRINRSMCFQYADDYGLDEEQKEDLWFHINVMDREFLDWWLKKQPKVRQGKEGASGGKRTRRTRDPDA